jgi:hypothetical protein
MGRKFYPPKTSPSISTRDSEVTTAPRRSTTASPLAVDATRGSVDWTTGSTSRFARGTTLRPQFQTARPRLRSTLQARRKRGRTGPPLSSASTTWDTSSHCPRTFLPGRAAESRYRAAQKRWTPAAQTGPADDQSRRSSSSHAWKSGWSNRNWRSVLGASAPARLLSARHTTSSSTSGSLDPIHCIAQFVASSRPIRPAIKSSRRVSTSTREGAAGTSFIEP